MTGAVVEGIQAPLLCWAPGGCTEAGVRRGLCDAHYRRVIRSGVLTKPMRRGMPGPSPRDPYRKFFSLVVIRPNAPRVREELRAAHPGLNTGCWIWQGSKTRSGYGRFFFNGHGQHVLAHRWAYEHVRLDPGTGQLVSSAEYSIPENHELDHLCRVIACCNPEHLEPVLQDENKRRQAEARRLKRAARARHHAERRRKLRRQQEQQEQEQQAA